MASPAGGDSRPLPPSPSSKGKAKMYDEVEAEGSGMMCGICHGVGGRRAIRGELDCCAHYFCFVCILAWGRIESRCPFCKARFRTIRRPPVPGRFPDERVVTVPERNQVNNRLISALNLITSNLIPRVLGVSVVEMSCP
jgi:PHD and RING finger domain-containing protein 1